MTERARPTAIALGSAHVDLIASASRLPGPGESVLGDGFAMAPGGKAANQAAQFARCGGRARLLARLGADDFGAFLERALADAGVDLSLVSRDPARATGASTVFAAAAADASLIAPGAAAALSAADVETAADALRGADALLLQLETPPEVSARAAEIASEAGAAVVLNPAPAPAKWDALPEALRRAPSALVVNRVEAARILGDEPVADRERALVLADFTLMDDALRLKERTGARLVIATAGAAGAVAVSDDEAVKTPAFRAEVADAVGAGDAFLGAFLASWLGGGALADALRRASAAAAIAVARPSAFYAQPDAAEIDAFLAARAGGVQPD